MHSTCDHSKPHSHIYRYLITFNHIFLTLLKFLIQSIEHFVKLLERKFLLQINVWCMEYALLKDLLEPFDILCHLIENKNKHLYNNKKKG